MQMSIRWDNKQALSPSPPTVVEKDNEMGHVLRKKWSSGLFFLLQSLNLLELTHQRDAAVLDSD